MSEGDECGLRYDCHVCGLDCEQAPKRREKLVMLDFLRGYNL